VRSIILGLAVGACARALRFRKLVFTTTVLLATCAKAAPVFVADFSTATLDPALIPNVQPNWTLTSGGGGTTPTFTWDVPAGSPHDAVRITIWDLEGTRAGGVIQDSVHVQSLGHDQLYRARHSKQQRTFDCLPFEIGCLKTGNPPCPRTYYMAPTVRHPQFG
jgi:hypothetical protein